jgi:hypothetical protein
VVVLFFPGVSLRTPCGVPARTHWGHVETTRRSPIEAMYNKRLMRFPLNVLAQGLTICIAIGVHKAPPSAPLEKEACVKDLERKAPERAKRFVSLIARSTRHSAWNMVTVPTGHPASVRPPNRCSRYPEKRKGLSPHPTIAERLKRPCKGTKLKLKDNQPEAGVQCLRTHPK